MRWLTLNMVILSVALLSLCAACTRASAPDSKRAAELRKILTPEQYYVTQENGTEPPYKNAYFNNHAAGIYVDVVSGEPLFSSLEKYESNTGWPSFWAPLVKENIVEKVDKSLFQTRTEIRSKKADSHLGHVFNDGPPPTGLRYCINSAAMKFIPAAMLQESGYGQFAYLFETKPSAPLQSNTPTRNSTANEQSVVFAGGCFWGIEAVFEHIKGVKSAVSGYSGGATKNPTYEQVSSGTSGHAEAVEVVFDSSVVTLESLLKVFFTVAHDPTEVNRQGPDIGSQYRSAIFYSSNEQKNAVTRYIENLKREKLMSKPIATQVTPLSDFYPAEAYHQDYLKRNPNKPYIVTYDLPKLEELKKKFPELWVAK